MRFPLEGPSLAAIQARALAEHGPAARIVSAEKVTVGGIGRFLARAHYEALIELPDGHAPAGRVLEPGEGTEPARTGEPARLPAPSMPGAPEVGARQPESLALGTFAANALTPDSPAVSGGINGLLARADAAELHFAPPRDRAGGRDAPLPGRPDFDRLLDSQAFALEPATGTRAAGAPSLGPGVRGERTGQAAAPGREVVPSPLAGPGDLVVVLGLWGDAGMAAAELDDGTALRRNAGELAQKFDPQALARKPITDRRGILRARAGAVADGVPLLVSAALNPLLELSAQLALLEVLAPDQLWVAVDAGRKPEDTAAWVKAVTAAHGIYAVVSLHAEETLSPESVWDMGFPVLEARGPGA